MKKITLIFSITFLLAMILTGCNADTPVSRVDDISESSTDDIPESFMIETENYFDYQSGLECAAFASAFVLRHYGEEADGVTLYENYPSKINGGGVSPYGIETFFNDRGYEAQYVMAGTIDDLKRELLKGAPVIAFIHVEEPYENSHATHYVPIVGYDTEYFYFAESLSYLANFQNEEDLPYNRKTEIEKFERLWKDIDSMWENPYFSITKISD